MRHSSRPFSHIRAEMLLGTVTALFLLLHVQAHGHVPGAGWVMTARAQGVPDTCAAGSATLAEAASPGGAAPDGFLLNPLGEGEFNQLPERTSPPLVRLQLSRLSFAPMTDTGLLEAVGPILYYVESGELAIAIDGDSARYKRDASVTVAGGEWYQVQNDTGEPTTVLALALTATEATVFPVANVGDTPTPSAAPGGLTVTTAASTPLFRVDLDADELPDLPGRLYLACAAWTMPPDTTLTLAHPGPVALRVVSGTLLRDDTTKPIPEGGCTSFAPGQARPTGAADQPVSVILFGILPVDQGLWQPVDGETTGSEGQDLRCSAE